MPNSLSFVISHMKTPREHATYTALMNELNSRDDSSCVATLLIASVSIVAPNSNRRKAFV